jgi:hypothetical protein
LEAGFADLAALGTINTVGEACAAWQAVHSGYAQYRQQLWPFWFCSHIRFADWQEADTRLGQLVDALPPAVLQQVVQMSAAQQRQAPSSAVVSAMLLNRLGWQVPGGKPYTLAAAPVKLLTALQLPTVRSAMQQRQSAFADSVAATVVGGRAHVDVQEVQDCCRHVWQLPWDNDRKEVYWRLVYDAYPTAARMGNRQDMPCACGVAVPDWQHHFWQCPVAHAVVRVMQAQLPPGSPTLQPVHLWLLRVPVPGMHAGVWQVAALAALHAMHKGCQLLTKWACMQRQGEIVPQHVATPAQRVQAATRLAVATLWDMVQDFVALRLHPPEWLMEVGAAHPFVCTALTVNAEPILCMCRRE